LDIHALVWHAAGEDEAGLANGPGAARRSANNAALADVAALLAASPSPVDAPDASAFGRGYRPLHYAAYRGHAPLCRVLLRAGAAVDARNDAGCTPLFLAAQQGHVACVEALLDAGADACAVDATHGFCAADVAADAPDVLAAIARGGSSGGSTGMAHTSSSARKYGPPARMGVPRLTFAAGPTVASGVAKTAGVYGASPARATAQRAALLLAAAAAGCM
jgi:hypothetical protein